MPLRSQSGSRSLSQRRSVLRRTDALPGSTSGVAALTPYSMVGARTIRNSAERSSASRSTMMASLPMGRCGPCCSQVPAGTMRRGCDAMASATSPGVISLRRRGVFT